MSEQPQHRFHGKVLVRRGDTEIHVNVFDDARDVVYLEIQQAIAQFSGDIKPATAAHRELARTAQAKAAAPPAATKPLNAPVCKQCGTNQSVELITWADKVTGEQRKEWKCQACKKWCR
ncbi:MAG: hypothetical protein ISS54_00750 [Dehalococcoidia bacterium]|nr:hypothetical protein [Dehalococcoidia bacterium]